MTGPEAGLEIPHSVIQSILNNVGHMFPYKIARLEQLLLQDYAQRDGFSKLSADNMSSNFPLLRLIPLPDECVYQVPG